MALDDNDFEDFVRKMRDDPGFRDRVRRLVLTEELLRMPVTLLHMAESVNRLAETADRHTQQFVDVVERLDALEFRTAGVESRLAVVETRLDSIDEHLDSINQRLDRLDSKTNTLDGNMGRVMGLLFETKFVDELPNRLARHFRRVKRVLPGDFPPLLRRLDEDDSFAKDFDDVMLLDVFASAVRRGDSEGKPVYAAIEISRSVAPTDVARAERRAAILRSLGLDVVAVVAGETIRDDARRLAESFGTVVLPQRGEPDPA